MSESISALSLWQPWATLIALGLKQFETRSWQRRSIIGQHLAIHASARWDGKVKRYAYNLVIHRPELRPHLLTEKGYVKSLPCGAVLCVCKLVDIYPTDEIQPQIGVVERLCGDWTPGRFAWKLDLVEVFDVPIPAQGHQLLWKWDWKAAASL